MARIERDIKLDFKDVLIKPKRSTLTSRSQVSLERHFLMVNSKVEWTGVPIMAANMDTTGTFAIAEALARTGCATALHKYYSVEDWRQWRQGPTGSKVPESCVAVSCGSSEDDLDRLAQVLAVVPKAMICLDVANGYVSSFTEAVRTVRKRFPSNILIAGNVCTAEMTEELILSGADIVKVGIGPGSACTTRRITGVGCPQLSAVLECADAAHGVGGRVMSDGGCTCPGDVCKAFGAGADFVMLGGMLAGHTESGGELEVDPETGAEFKTFYGMSSETAMSKYAGGVASYRTGEGKTVRLPYRGPVELTVLDILGGIRSCCTYVGAKSLKELPRRCTFYMVHAQMNDVFGPPKEDFYKARALRINPADVPK